jgi:uncharacterized membrane-anchored protein YhcB (DUF1043 family)
MGTLGWLLVIAVGIALGFSVGRLWPGSAAKITELERQRDAAREDLRTYRQDVSNHFERTAQLFDKVTADYRGLYEHLAVGARQLSAIPGESIEARLAEPEQRRLGTAVGAAGAAAAATTAASSEAAPSVQEEIPVQPPRDYDESPEPEPTDELLPEPETAARDGGAPETLEHPADVAPEAEPKNKLSARSDA